MKKLKIYLFSGLSLIMGLLVSCNHDAFLQENPQSLLAPPDFPATQDDADLIMGGISNIMINQDFANRSLFFLTDISSDETVVRFRGNDREEIDQYNYTLDNQHVRNTYEICYQVINQCNLLIKYLPEDQPWGPKYIGAAKFYRALMYSYLVRLWGPTIIVTEPTEEILGADQIVRSPELDVFNLIVSDLTYAEGTLPLSWTGNPDQTDDGRPTIGAAKMLLAKMHLTMAGFPLNDNSKWALAKTKALEVINLGPYRLMPDFASNFLIANQNNPEHIISYQMAEVSGMTSIQARPSGGGLPNPGFYLWQAQPYKMNLFDPTDDRLTGTFLTTLEGVAYTRWSRNSSFPHTPAMAKYQDFGRDNVADNNRRTKLNLPIFRIAEAHLIVAEAENEINGPTIVAYNALNLLRTRATAPAITEGLSKDAFRDAVHLEWSLELMHEMKRRFNLLRWGTMDAVMATEERASIGYAPYKKYYNIPQTEFDRGLNPDLQTPGY